MRPEARSSTARQPGTDHPIMIETPVAVIVFNRPDATARLLRRLATIRPRRLFVIADGPRVDVAGEESRVAAVARLFQDLPWSCQVVSQSAHENLGCRRRVTSGLDWLFAEVPRAIILEDDCLPTESFFPYCEELLERYAADDRVASVCGMTHDLPGASGPASYRFSRYCFIWGWATWRRAWERYDPGLTPLDDGTIDDILRGVFPGWRARLYWKAILRRCQRGQLDTWDYPWLLSCWKHAMVHAVPSVSMVENIGIGSGATHTTVNPYAVPAASDLAFPLRHPEEVAADPARDDSVEDRIFSRSLPNRVAWLRDRLVRSFGR